MEEESKKQRSMRGGERKGAFFLYPAKKIPLTAMWGQCPALAQASSLAEATSDAAVQSNLWPPNTLQDTHLQKMEIDPS